MFSICKNNFKRDKEHRTRWTNKQDMWSIPDEKEKDFYLWIKNNAKIIKQPKWDRLYQTAKVEISCDKNNEVPKQELLDKLTTLFDEYDLSFAGQSIDTHNEVLHLTFAGENKCVKGE